ncbi:hypothetical protein C5167_016205 [Papaver somniferum]|nr:hypothetical protein C5167_016205 [Papaver somniferum]
MDDSPNSGIPIKKVVKELKFVPFLVNKLLELNEIKTSTKEKLLGEFFQGDHIYASLYESYLSDDSTEQFAELKKSAERAMMALLDNTICSWEVTKLEDSEVPNLCLENDVQGIQRMGKEVEQASVEIQTVGEEEENIEIVTNMKAKTE